MQAGREHVIRRFALFTLASATGAALVGFALDHSVGISAVLRWMAGLSLLPASIWGLWTIWSVREGKSAPIE